MNKKQPNPKVSLRDKEILRKLAGRMREIADLPEQKKRQQRLYDLNGLKPDRPIILCFPEGAWVELVPESVIECADPLLRLWEISLRQKIYWWEKIRDDHTLEPYFNLSWDFDRGDMGVVAPKTQGADRGSFVWDPPLKDLENDMAKLHFRRPTVDREKTKNRVALADSIFGDLLTVRVRGYLAYWWSMGLTGTAIELIGLENLMLYMYDKPAALHRLMAWLRDEHINYIEWIEKEGLITQNNRDDYTGSGGVAYTHELPQADWKPGRPVRLKDVWGFSESQETVGISPAMFSEFIFPYQLPILEKFGLNCYGCCEGVHERLDYILKIPRLRRISVSPWANQEILAQRLGKKYVFSRKPNPSQICVSFDEKAIRDDLRTTLAIAGHGVLEIIMKDTHTVEHKPERITRWVEIALEEVERFMEKKK